MAPAPSPGLHPVFAPLPLWNTTGHASASGQSVLLLSFDQLLVLLKDFGVLGPLIDLHRLHRAFKAVKLWEWALSDAAAPPPSAASSREPQLFRPATVATAKASAGDNEQGRAALDTLDPLGVAAASRSLNLTLG